MAAPGSEKLDNSEERDKKGRMKNRQFPRATLLSRPNLFRSLVCIRHACSRMPVQFFGCEPYSKCCFGRCACHGEGLYVTQPGGLFIVGASARAAAFSALRAGFVPSCADLYADRDLRQKCLCSRIPAHSYPAAIENLLRNERMTPWIYTGALENRPRLLERWAAERPLWGNSAEMLAKARSPSLLHDMLASAGFHVPVMWDEPPTGITGMRVLAKPRKGAAGIGIADWDRQKFGDPRGHYFQEFIDGPSISLVFVADSNKAIMLGGTQQLIGETWLNCAGFQYCGSIGPVEFPSEMMHSLTRLGSVLAHGCGLLGLFGVDGVLRDGNFWPVEVNPRYTASVEVLEYATGTRAISLHSLAFDPEIDFPSSFRSTSVPNLIGKAILFARSPFVFPREGPWDNTLREDRPVNLLPEFADIPDVGEPITAGQPILTFFAAGESLADVHGKLQHRAGELDRILGNA